MKQNSFLGQWLILGVVLICLGGAVGYNLFLERGRIQSREEERLLTLTRVIDQNAAQNLIAISQVLMRLRNRLQQDTQGPELNENLKILVDAMPGVRTVAILDVNGNILASNQPSIIGSNFSQRDYFKAPRQHPDQDMLYVSPPFRTVLGVFAISTGVMIPDSRGEFAGVITATLDPQYFATLLDSVRYAPDMGVSIVHWDGVIFMTEPVKKGVAGKNLAQPGSFFTRHKDSGQTASVFTGATYASGAERMIALRTVNSSKLKLDKPLIVTAARDPGEIYAAWRIDLIKHGSLYGLVALFSILALVVFQRRQRESNRQLDEAAEELHVTHVQIRESEEKYRAIIETTDTGYVILDASGRVSDANNEYVRLSGHARLAEIVGRNPMEWTAEHDRERTAEEMKKGLETGGVRNLELDYSDAQGRTTPVEINATVVQREASLQMVSLCRDISERKRSQAQIEQLAYYDALTNLPNRRLMLERLTLGLLQVKRFHRSLAIMFMDLDRFKEINDSLGHDVGDELLKVVAQRLSTCVRGGDIVSRQGGDEFVVVLTEMMQPEDATLVAEKIVSVLREPMIVLEHELHVTISIGIVVFPVEGVSDPMELMKRADIAMYEAKKGGGDGFRVSR